MGRKLAFATVTLLLACSMSGCSTFRSVLGLNQQTPKVKPIDNPFGSFFDGAEARKRSVYLRSKNGPQSVEVELPAGQYGMTDFVVPVSPRLRNSHRGIASVDPNGNPVYHQDYSQQSPTQTDRAIARKFPQGDPRNHKSRNQIEGGLGLMPIEGNQTPEAKTSYLGALDTIKSLYKKGRYEVALIEIDKLLKYYPTDSKLHEMKGTLLNRLGYTDIAMKAWQQALRLNPGNKALVKYVAKQKKQQELRELASP